MLADTRARVERNDDEPPRMMPRVERESRLAVGKDRFPGVMISEALVPGPSAVDAFGEMADLGQIKHIAWNKMISQRMEASGAKVSR